MRTAISLREDFDGEGLRRLARQSKHAAQARRLLALALIYDGGSRTDATRLSNVTLQIVRDWVMRFNANGPEGLIDGKAPGLPGSRTQVTVERCSADRIGKSHGTGADALSRRCRALAFV